MDTVSFLALCKNISHLVISGNPVCSVDDYRTAIKSFIPSLKILDDFAFVDAELAASLSSSEYQSSTTTSLSNAKACSSAEFSELTGKSTSNKLRLGSATTPKEVSGDGWAPRAQSAGADSTTN